MANYTAADIKALREKTAAGMMDVKKALDEADGDMAKATTSNGLVAAQADGGVGTLVEVLCETDFVAKGERFLALGDQVLAQAVASGASNADELLASTLPSGQTVQELLDDANATIGEKIEIKRVACGLPAQDQPRPARADRCARGDRRWRRADRARHRDARRGVRADRAEP